MHHIGARHRGARVDELLDTAGTQTRHPGEFIGRRVVARWAPETHLHAQHHTDLGQRASHIVVVAHIGHCSACKRPHGFEHGERIGKTL